MQKKILTKGFIIRIVVLLGVTILIIFLVMNKGNNRNFKGDEFIVGHILEDNKNSEKDILNEGILTDNKSIEVDDLKESIVDINESEEGVEELTPELLKKVETIESFRECKDAGFKITSDSPPECWAGENGFYEVDQKDNNN